MPPEVDRLLDALSELREDRRSIGPHHPKFVEWLTAVRQCLAGADDRTALDRFETLRVARSTNAMWRREELPPGELREVLSDLDKLEKILSGMATTAHGDSLNRASRPGCKTSQQPDAEEPPAAVADATKEPTVNKSADTSGRSNPPQPGRFKAMEVLLADLGDELKRPEGDLNRIQRMMGDLLDLKKTGDLVERALSAAADPAARWDSVRAPLAQLWAANREVVLDILPALLKKP